MTSRVLLCLVLVTSMVAASMASRSLLDTCSALCTNPTLPNRCCNADGTTGVCCAGGCGATVTSPDGSTYATCQAPPPSCPPGYFDYIYTPLFLSTDTVFVKGPSGPGGSAAFGDTYVYSIQVVGHPGARDVGTIIFGKGQTFSCYGSTFFSTDDSVTYAGDLTTSGYIPASGTGKYAGTTKLYQYDATTDPKADQQDYYVCYYK